MLNNFLIILGLVISLNTFSQDDQYPEDYQDAQANQEIQEDDVQELIDRSEKIYEAIDIDDQSPEDLANRVDELEKQYLGKGDSKQVINQKINIEDAIKQINKRYLAMPIELVRKEILGSVENDFLKKAYTNYPSLLTFVARILKTPDALLDAFTTVRNKPLMKKFGLYMLGTLVLSIVLSKLLIKEGQGFIDRFKAILIKSLVIWTARISVLVYFLGSGLSKVWHIFIATFIS